MKLSDFLSVWDSGDFDIIFVNENGQPKKMTFTELWNYENKCQRSAGIDYIRVLDSKTIYIRTGQAHETK